MSDPIHIVLISGSIRQPSYTRTLTEKVEAALVTLGAATTHWNLREAPLPIADPSFHHDPLQHTNKRVRHLVTLAVQSDGFVFGSPIYHNSHSGVLKNALDHLAIAQFYYKPVGLISHGGNRSTQAVDHLRIVVRGLLGVAIPTQVCTTSQDYCEIAKSSDYELTSKDILERIDRFALELMLFAQQLRLTRQSTLKC